MVITIPLSQGALYKVASCFEKLGRTNELTRLWQLHFHSPHIYYFNKKNFEQLMGRNGCELIQCKDIRSIDINKMQERFEMDADEKHGKLKARIFRWIYPILQCLPADKAVFLFRYKANNITEEQYAV